MWFCGWDEGDFHKTSLSFLERQQTKNLDVYREFYEMNARMLISGGLMIVHIGGSDEHDMVRTLVDLGSDYLKLVDVVKEDVRGSEHHGLKDKGLTTSHNFLFFSKA